jgi:5-methyltetrahydrofolate corrinoid/iron sulfur protein methyltransferase
MKIIADTLNALNPRVYRALEQSDPEPIQTLAIECRKKGAHYLDINPGYLPKAREDRIVFMIEAVQAVSDLELVLDSPNPRVLSRGLAACRGRAVINALTLEEEKLDRILPLAVEYDCPLVLLLLDARSRPPNTLEEKIALAVELRERALSGGLREELLIFDPLMPHTSWPDSREHFNAALAFIRLAASGALFNQPAETVIGLSNLRSGYNRAESLSLERTSLSLMAGAGLSHVLMNVFRTDLVEEVGRMRQLGEG